MKIMKFLQLAAALIQGDDSTAVSIKIQNKAEATLKSQIAIKEAKTLDLQENLEDANEVANKALVNYGTVITDKKAYIENLFNADEKIKACQEELDSHLEDIKFLQAKLAIVQAK